MRSAPARHPGSSSRVALLRAIARLGFRRWYERRLIEAHAWLAACFLSMVIVAAGVELLRLRGSAAELILDASLVAAGALLAWFAWRRYATGMYLAAMLGEQAVCPGCERFGFRCDPLQPPDGRALAVHCARCGRHWQVGDGVDADG
ncbi:hypothetical protein [Quisquiliibacterium transsilvanicum]|uniref:Uncharacterized protein n=1 Tax=Quisquiliibacterium transsilvanicum TaxID=1549638 RepID=A0A7W8HFR1_9BURK|nr:hypothetical protein [Quisquiliibacterium transsilvanicum]MBB5271239.1 hypothetical protein [Quisquiliibacterium transsilvanicum]